jgi:hypothetical protein
MANIKITNLSDESNLFSDFDNNLRDLSDIDINIHGGFLPLVIGLGLLLYPRAAY